MKKSFFVSLLTVVLLALGITSVTASATEPKSTEAAQNKLEEAQKYYLDNMVAGVGVARKISGQSELSAKQNDAIRTACEKWLNEELIPFLSKNDILKDWVAMQFDEDVRKLNLAGTNVKTRDELMEFAKKCGSMSEKKYPVFFKKSNTPEGKDVLMKLQIRLLEAIQAVQKSESNDKAPRK